MESSKKVRRRTVLKTAVVSLIGVTAASSTAAADTGNKTNGNKQAMPGVAIGSGPSQNQYETLTRMNVRDPYTLHIEAVDGEGNPVQEDVGGATLTVSNWLGSFGEAPANHYSAFGLNIRFRGNRGLGRLRLGTIQQVDVRYEIFGVVLDSDEVTESIEVGLPGDLRVNRMSITPAQGNPKGGNPQGKPFTQKDEEE